MKKTTVLASSDIALIKYWGKKDEILRLPENGSLSIILKGLDTVTTVQFDENLKQDQITIQGESEEGEASRVINQLERIRQLAGKSFFAKVVSQNTFPKGTGLSSSGSGFAALTIAACRAIGLELDEKEQSILARQGSGTACRCVCGGFVEWKDGESSETSYSESIYSPQHWDIRDVVAVVDEGKKLISSTAGHATAHSSPFYETRLKNIGQKLVEAKKLIGERDFEKLGDLVEKESLEFHSILLTSNPSMIAWYPGTLDVMLAVQAMRREGIQAYFTINTGFNVHILTLPEFESELEKKISKLSCVKKVLKARVGEGPKELENHLF